MEMYKKVYIKSEADLPTEDGDYFGMEIGSINSFMSVLDFKKDKELRDGNGAYWMKFVEWYLQPISAVNEPEKPTDEEIEKEAIALFESGMALENESPISYTHKQLRLHEAQTFRAGAKWMRNKLTDKERR